MKRIAARLRPSLEAIQYQGKSGLNTELTLLYRDLIESKDLSKASLAKVNAAVEKVIKKYTGLTTEFKISPEAGSYNAWAMFPLLDLNNPLLVFWRNALGVEQHRVTLSQVKKVSDTLRGEIDLQKGRVSGVFANLKSKLRISPDFFTNPKFTEEEIAAITMHEIGHCFTYFEKLLSTVSINMAISTAAAELAQTEDPKIRIELVYETSKFLDAPVEDPEKLAEEKSEEAFQAVLIKATIDKHLHSAGNASTYDLRSCEFLADQFATRQGAGRALATGLDKMMRLYGHTSTYSTPAYVAVESAKFALTILALVFATPPIAALIGVQILMSLTLGAHEGRIYDDPNERVSRIKNDLIQTLKNTAIDPELRHQILKDLEVIDAVRDELKDRRTLMNYIWIACTSKRREQFRQLRFQQELEKMINNEMYVTASKLEDVAAAKLEPLAK